MSEIDSNPTKDSGGNGMSLIESLYAYIENTIYRYKYHAYQVLLNG